MTKEKKPPTNQESVIALLINKQSYYKELVEPFILAKNHLMEMQFLIKDDIEKQFKEEVYRTIADDITMNLAIPAEDVYEVLETLNLDEYLKF